MNKTIKFVAACRNSNGVPTLVNYRFDTTHEDVRTGDAYDAIIEHLQKVGYTGPFVVIDEFDLNECGEPLRTLIRGLDWTREPILNKVS